MSPLGENIELLCKINGITKKELAKRAGISFETIRNIERGSVKVRRSTLQHIANVFDIRPEELADKEENENSSEELTEIGKNIQKFCKIRNMSKEELSKEAGVCEKTLDNIIWGRTVARADTLVRIAKALNIRVTDLRNEKGTNISDAKASSILEKIKRFCDSKNITQLEFARNSGISVTAMNKIDNDKVKTRKSTLEYIANAMGITVEELINI